MAIESKIIKELITQFNMSDVKRKMLEGERYFRDKNDILKKDLFFVPDSKIDEYVNERTLVLN